MAEGKNNPCKQRECNHEYAWKTLGSHWYKSYDLCTELAINGKQRNSLTKAWHFIYNYLRVIIIPQNGVSCWILITSFLNTSGQIAALSKQTDNIGQICKENNLNCFQCWYLTMYPQHSRGNIANWSPCTTSICSYNNNRSKNPVNISKSVAPSEFPNINRSCFLEYFKDPSRVSSYYSLWNKRVRKTWCDKVLANVSGEYKKFK